MRVSLRFLRYSLLGLLAMAACGGGDSSPPLSPPWSPPSPDPGGPGPSVPGPAASMFDESRILDFHLTFPAGAWERLLNPQGPQDQHWVPCTFQFDGQTAQAACRRKGNLEHWPREKKPQIIVRFNLTDTGGRFRGLRRLNLESFWETAAPIRDRLAMWMMREAGLPASRVNHVRVFKDGTLLGLYQNIEAIDREFLERHFGADAGGNLWEAGEPIELKTNEAINDQSRLHALEALVDDEPLQGDHTAFFGKLPAMIDVDEVLREMAAETVALADDNFSNGGSNYYLYDHPRRGFLVLPWDFDTIFLAVTDADPWEFWDGADPNKLRQLMNQNPAWRTRFSELVAQIRDSVLPRMPDQVLAMCNQVREAVRQDPNRVPSFQDFEDDCQHLRQQAPARQQALKQMLGQ
jgi:spore coat protein CotH